MSFRSAAASLLLVATATVPVISLAQAHEITQGGYTLRSSTVSSSNVDPATAQRHGIEPSPNRGLLNVVVSRKRGKGSQTVHADVHASVSGLTGKSREVPMKEVEENGFVSYMGSYEFAPREVLDYRVTARPGGRDPKLELKYRDRVWKRQ